MRLQMSLFSLLALSSTASSAADAQAQLSSAYTCEDPPYKVHMVSQSPLVIYITDFLTPFERSHLQAITKNTFSRSSITGSQPHNQHIRTSQSTNVPRDAVVRCVEDRALAFQGLDTPRSRLEPVQLVRYGAGEHFHFHTDWHADGGAAADPRHGGDRLSSFFAYVAVEDGTTGGGTSFPLVDAPPGEGWCALGHVDCDEEWERGVAFRPVEGNAVFWLNLLPDGSGDPRTLHAGLPVTSGGKVGMNIWTRQAPVSEEIRGPDV